MAQTTCEMMWFYFFLSEFGFSVDVPMSIHCDNQTVIFITNNLIFYERTKHIEVDCHYILDMMMKWVISTPYTQSSDQLVDIFTKGLSVEFFESLCNKLGMIDIYVLTWGGVLDLLLLDLLCLCGLMDYWISIYLITL